MFRAEIKLHEFYAPKIVTNLYRSRIFSLTYTTFVSTMQSSRRLYILFECTFCYERRVTQFRRQLKNRVNHFFVCLEIKRKLAGRYRYPWFLLFQVLITSPGGIISDRWLQFCQMSLARANFQLPRKSNIAFHLRHVHEVAFRAVLVRRGLEAW